jgi:cathepsin C
MASSLEGGEGTFTMIYDEGFEVAIDGLNFFAFSRFEFVNGPSGRTNVSHCDETQVGWYHNEDRSQWGCYVAKKTGAPGGNQTAPQTPPTSLAQLGSRLRLQVPKSAGYNKPVTATWQRAVAEGLNLLELGWTAVAYSHYTGKTPKEMNRLAGIRRSIVKGPKHTPAPSSFLSVQSKLRRASASAPDSFSWQNKDGQSWIGDVVTQGDCGSCYTISTVNMLSARNRIRRGSPGGEQFSIKFPLYCSEYNQGCDGGYGFLQSKWSEDVGLVPEHCHPFEGSDQCGVAAGCNVGTKRYRATNHHYVGGFYGASREDNIREELVNGGPVVMSFEPTEDFMYYKGGVYKSGPGHIHEEWEQVDHAVLLIGYGEDKGAPYWTMQNSWGTDWGEQGFFRMARGHDESSCESIVVAADVVEEDANPVLDDFLAGLA